MDTRQNDILSVRYGRYSCRIEGIKDPVAALRTITEQLAALLALDPDLGRDMIEQATEPSYRPQSAPASAETPTEVPSQLPPPASGFYDRLQNKIDAQAHRKVPDITADTAQNVTASPWSRTEPLLLRPECRIYATARPQDQSPDEGQEPDLAQLLMAAAREVSLIDGRERFSVSDVMATLSANGRYTREKRIRSFGALLRAGAIIRIGHGLYRLSATASR